MFSGPNRDSDMFQSQRGGVGDEQIQSQNAGKMSLAAILNRDPSEQPSSLQGGGQPDTYRDIDVDVNQGSVSSLTDKHCIPGHTPTTGSNIVNKGPLQAGSLNNSVPQWQGLPFNLLAGPIPPLSKERFNSSYRSFCTQKNITHEQRLLSINGFIIDLYALHVEVIKERGASMVRYLPFASLPECSPNFKVQHGDLWPVVAGRLGYVQFPGEPPMSGQAAAHQLAHVYKEYLMEFDCIYMTAFVEQRRKNMMLAQLAQTPIFTKYTVPQIKTLVEFSKKSVQEMRLVNLSEVLIHGVEGHRQQLQVLAREENLLRVLLAMKSSQERNVGVTPSHQTLYQALRDVHELKESYLQRCIPVLLKVDVPIEQRQEYVGLLEQVHIKATSMDQKLHYLHFVGKNEQNTKVVISKVINVQQQRIMMGQDNPQFIMTLDGLRKADRIVQNALEFVVRAGRLMAIQR
ncbi:hypothetical protein VNI00_005166 [Paramarasmius palmivorus]|uniref:ARID domain-containing protein n=1 Tax=Paramarasmius palmivorus TaxID=297713 RepID=A0AAW0DIX2_9AGAR